MNVQIQIENPLQFTGPWLPETPADFTKSKDHSADLYEDKRLALLSTRVHKISMRQKYCSFRF